MIQSGSTSNRAPPVDQLFGQATSLLQHGRLAEASAVFERILNVDPKHFGSLQYLAMIRLQNGKPDLAVALLRRALNQDPKSAEIHSNLGMSFQALAHYDEALEHCKKAIAINPRYAIGHNNLGNALAALQRHEEAIRAFERATAIKPDYAEALNNLGAALRSLGRHDDAIARLQQALALNPNFLAAHVNLAHAFAAAGRPAEAIHHYGRALALKPDLFEALIGLGDASRGLGRLEAAVAAYRKATAVRPSSADAHEKLGVALEETGKIEAARKSFQAAIGAEPKRVSAYLSLVRSGKIGRADPTFAAMEAMADDLPSLPAEDRVALHFALGKALADIGEHERSFRHYLDGNALKRSQITYDEAKRLGVLDRIRGVFTHALMQTKERGGEPSSGPIFILGMPRSGSTLVEQILASHPMVVGLGERLDLRDAVKSAGASVSFPELVTEMTGDGLRGLGADYLARLTKARLGATPVGAERDPTKLMTDKMPANFRYVGLIHLALPNARIIHTVRDPIDTCLSCFSQLFAENHQPFTYDLGELGRYYRAYSELMEHWRGVLPEGAVLDVQYEELVGDFEAQARRVVAYCGLDWDDACLAFHKTDRPVKTASVIQVRQPIYRSSVGRWRPNGDVLRPLLEGLELHPAGELSASS